MPSYRERREAGEFESETQPEAAPPENVVEENEAEAEAEAPAAPPKKSGVKVTDAE